MDFTSIDFDSAKAITQALLFFQINQTPNHDKEIIRCKREMKELGVDITQFTDENISCIAMKNAGFIDNVLVKHSINIEGVRYQALSEVFLLHCQYQSRIHQTEQQMIKSDLSDQMGKEAAESILDMFSKQGKVLRRF